MARPEKDKRLLMNVPLRILLTQDQKRLLEEAVADDPGGMAAWARTVLIQAARDRIAGRKGRSDSKMK